MATPQDYTINGGASAVKYDPGNQTFMNQGNQSSFSVAPSTAVAVPTSIIGQTAPLKVPSISPTLSTTPILTPPLGTTTDTNGNASIIPPAEKSSASSTYDLIKSSLGEAGAALATKADVTQNLQNEMQLAQKTETATKDYNAFQQAKLGLQQQVASIYDQPGITREQAGAQASEITRIGNANLANLAFTAQASQGLLSAAQQTIKDKLDAQFGPIKEQIDFLTQLAQVNANDLSEGDKIKLMTQADKTKTELAAVTGVADALHQELLQNSAPITVYSALDKINNDYASGKITAAQAQSAMYQAAGEYGVDTSKVLDNQLKKAQLNKINKETAALGVNSVTNTNAADYATAVNVVLGSTKLTKQQKNDFIAAMNSGGDPFQIIKNKAKDIMGQTEATTVTKYEVARDTLADVGDQLAAFYAAGGKTSLIKGNFEKVINNLGSVTDPDLVALATQIQGNLQIYRNAISGTAYSAQEGKDISSIFPGINKSESLNTAILSGRKTLFDSVIDSSYRSALGSSYDTLKTLQGGDSNPFSQAIGNNVLSPGQSNNFGTIISPTGGFIIPTK